MKHTDLAIVGAGIMGLAHAVHAVRAGLSVTVFERGAKADGASVRNFGMLAVVAQNPGPELQSAEHALATWQDVAKQANIEMQQTGCLFVARAPEEMSVLEEFATSATQAGRVANVVTRDQMETHGANITSENVIGGLWSPDAWKLDQRQAMNNIATWLERNRDVTFHFGAEVHEARPSHLKTSVGTFSAKHIIVCGGDEYSTLFPSSFQSSSVTSCQLQMLRTTPQPAGWQLKPFILGGLSMTRYSAFSSCPSLPALRKLQHEKYPDHLAHGIHVIACQEFDGSITIGDSHAYGDDLDESRSDEIDRLILEELSGMIALPDTRIAERWLGHYAHLPSSNLLKFSPAEGVTAVTMTNGQGMTHAFAVASEIISDVANEIAPQ